MLIFIALRYVSSLVSYKLSGYAKSLNLTGDAWLSSLLSKARTVHFVTLMGSISNETSSKIFLMKHENDQWIIFL